MSTNTNSLFGGSKMMGVCYSPYHQDGVAKKDYTEADIKADLKIVKSHFGFIRTYTVQHAQSYLPQLCQDEGVGLALGCWIFTGTTEKELKQAKIDTETEIDTALAKASAHPGQVKIIVIGNEVDLAANNYSVSQVTDAFNYAVTQKKTYPNLKDIPLTICMTGKGPTDATWKPLLSLMQTYAFLTIYPWYGQTPANVNPSEISGNMEWSYDNGMVQCINAGLEVVIAEIGWPSAGVSDMDTNWASEVANYTATCSWINGTNTQSTAYITMWFEMFDEPWKTAEGPQGPHWGLYTSGTTPTMKTNTAGTKFTPCSESKDNT